MRLLSQRLDEAATGLHDGLPLEGGSTWADGLWWCLLRRWCFAWLSLADLFVCFVSIGSFDGSSSNQKHLSSECCRDLLCGMLSRRDLWLVESWLLELFIEVYNLLWACKS